MAFQYIPSGFVGTWTPKPVYKIIQKYLEDNWTEDDVPKKSEIRFGYFLNENVGDVRTALSLKCWDHGQDLYEKGTNAASCMIVNKIIVHVEGRRIMENVPKDEPIGFEDIEQKIMTLISSDPLALKDVEGIHKMKMETTDPIYPIKDKQQWFAMNINLSTLRFMSRVTIP